MRGFSFGSFRRVPKAGGSSGIFSSRWTGARPHGRAKVAVSSPPCIRQCPDPSRWSLSWWGILRALSLSADVEVLLQGSHGAADRPLPSSTVQMSPLIASLKCSVESSLAPVWVNFPSLWHQLFEHSTLFQLLRKRMAQGPQHDRLRLD
ncbi:photosystem I subunit O [Iris pallida]|uniref:Photosystem I subunit O n=1 Tax=Iris pallida TaxID=29817 RepID=A0AAX6DVZ2_IRIPA|nr:photosystem I subunit O [Iris pallida]